MAHAGCHKRARSSDANGGIYPIPSGYTLNHTTSGPLLRPFQLLSPPQSRHEGGHASGGLATTSSRESCSSDSGSDSDVWTDSEASDGEGEGGAGPAAATDVVEALIRVRGLQEEREVLLQQLKVR